MALLERLERAEGFTEVERELAAYIIEHADDIASMSINELTTETCSSNASIIRLCHKLGLSGYRELRVRLSAELEHRHAERASIDPDEPFAEGESVGSVMGSIAGLLKNAVDDAHAAAIEADVERAASYVWEAQTVYVFATGDSLVSAMVFSNLLIKLGIHVVLANQNGEELAHAHTAQAGDAAIFVSYSGKLVVGTVMREIQRILASRCVRRIWISAGVCPAGFDVDLRFPAREEKSGKLATFYSQACIRYLLDCIYAVVWSFDYKGNQKRKASIDDSDLMLSTLRGIED